MTTPGTASPVPQFDPIVRVFWEGECRGNWHEGPRRIYDCLLDYVGSGEYELVLGTETHVFKSGAVIIVPPGIRSEGRLTQKRFAFRHCVHFSWNADFADRKPPLQTPAEEPFRTVLAHPVPPAIAHFLPLFTYAEPGGFLSTQMKILLKALREKQEHCNLLLWPVLRFLLTQNQKRGSNAAAVNSTGIAVLNVKSFIETHYFEEIGYEDFCNLTQMSQSYVCEIFQNIVGIPPTAYLNNIRLQHARRLLREETLSIKEVAMTVGIRDANYFARQFRKRFGKPPSEYRAHAQ
jgi:AraC-like DNA-binding protein